MLTEFSVAAFRFGHSLLPTDIPQIDNYGRIKEKLKLRDMFLQPGKMTGDRLEWMFKGLSTVHAKEKNCKVIDDVRNFLFLNNETKILVDLVSLNIQRQRDTGVQGYKTMRKYFGLPEYTSYWDLTRDYETAHGLNKVYGSNLDCDLWVGVVCEPTVYKGVLGDVGAHIVATLFKNIRKGDK